MSELLPCQCGATPILVSSHHRKKAQVICDGCGIQARPVKVLRMDMPFAEAAAIKQWNTRATPWRPIAEAPRDGTPVDLWVVFPIGARRWADAQWLEKHNCSGPANWCTRDKMPLHAFIDKPVATHFMPLPAPPTN
jgi:hypothetical protein